MSKASKWLKDYGASWKQGANAPLFNLAPDIRFGVKDWLLIGGVAVLFLGVPGYIAYRMIKSARQRQPVRGLGSLFGRR